VNQDYQLHVPQYSVMCERQKYGVPGLNVLPVNIGGVTCSEIVSNFVNFMNYFLARIIRARDFALHKHKIGWGSQS